MKIPTEMSPTSPSIDTQRPNELWTYLELLQDDLLQSPEGQMDMDPSLTIVATVPEDGTDACFYKIKAPSPTLPQDFMEGDQINTTTPLPDNAPTITTLPDNAPTVTTLPDNAPTVTTLPDNATTVTKTLPDNAPTVTKTLPDNAPTVTTLPDNAPTVTKTLPDNAPTVTTLPDNATTVTKTLPDNAPTVTTLPDNAPTVTKTLPDNAPTVTKTLPDNAPTVTKTLPDNATTVTKTLPDNAPTVTTLDSHHSRQTTTGHLSVTLETSVDTSNNILPIWKTVDQQTLSEPMTTLEVPAGVQEQHRSYVNSSPPAGPTSLCLWLPLQSFNNHKRTRRTGGHNNKEDSHIAFRQSNNNIINIKEEREENLHASPEPSPSPPASEPSPPLQQQQQQQQQPLVRVQSASHLPQPHVSPAMGVSSDTLSFSGFPNMQKVMMYTVHQPSVQTNLPTLIMPQPPVQPGSSGVSGGNGGMGGMLDVPTLTDSKGEYGFTVSVEEKERTTKSPMWLMSPVTNKLYTNINKAVPFEVRLGNPPADRSQLQVRIVPVFSSPQFLRTNVTRCPNHSAPNDPTNHDFPYPEYVVRADHPLADYVQGANGRLAVVVPLDPLQDGPDYTPILLRFMCLGSCVGGINRRPIAIILTLENNQGECLGRKVVDVRVCACPTRDIKTDEQAAKGTKRKGVTTQENLTMYRKQPRLIEPKTDSEDDDQIFTIKVRGAALYKFLLGVKNMYYESHPDYAQQYPDISQHSVSSSLIHKKKATKKEVRNKQENVSEIDNGLWESVTGSPTNSDHQLDEPPTDPLETNTNNSSPSNRMVQSQLKVLLVERNGINSPGESEVANGEFKLQPQTELKDIPLVMTSTSSNEGVTAGSVVSQHTKVFPRHVPVMPVSTYQSTMRRVASEPTRTKQTPRILRPPSAPIQSPGRTVCIRTNPVKIERNLSPVREGSVSPGSKEMLAANVLSERFYQDSSFT
ncbi:hypothetical protein Pcinc_039468 [Petrolisthes cinctipes]|uniref:p53 DNA-binding domain-containing protein n=1 Tax=Petrolisthes cinctipes TaxID=88211 RepID=A0AAE1BR60_PETCI|nr:hypothetical protein Pcinc_039468 [Petrolisthes cinctipes]